MSEWNGVPQNPERDGWHWLRHRDASFCTPVEWRHPGGWVANNIPLLPNEVQRFVIDCCEYLGPCLMPEKIAAKDARIAELEAALATARRDAMEEAAQDLEGRAKMLRSFDPDSVGAHWAWHYAAAIRAALEGGKDENDNH